MVKIFSLLIAMALLSAVVGCGKKAESDKPALMVDTRPLESDLQKFLEKQQVVCEAGQVCPTYLSKIVVINGSQVKYCTGFLVKSDVVATSSSCLTNFLRLDNQDCSKDIFFFFGRSFNRMPQKVGCSKVIQASSLVDKDPVLWRNDVAFLQMSESLDYKRSLQISRDGLQAAKIFTLWGIEQVDDTTGFIRRDECEAVFNSYINPIATDESSPSATVAGCNYKNGFTGAPLIDGRGKLRGTVSQGIDQKLKEDLQNSDLLVRPLKDFLHVTNYACAPTIFNEDTLNEAECHKNIDSTIVDNIRYQMFSPDVLFGEMKSKVEAAVAGISPYINFEVSVSGSGNLRTVDIYPKCFKKISSWLWTFNRSQNNKVFENWLPQKSFKRIMDSYGKIQGLEVNKSDKRFYFQMSLKALRNSSSSHVYMWDDSENPSRVFENLVDCKI